jgi:hypothetical protein
MTDVAAHDNLKQHTGLSAEKLSTICRTIGSDPRVTQIVLFGDDTDAALKERIDRVGVRLSGVG